MADFSNRPLGRVVNHDPRSLAYQVVADATVVTKRWDRVIPVLDQGDVGSCTGNAAVGHLGTQPEDATLTSLKLTMDESLALKLYSAAEVIDGDGPYPPNDNGSSGLSVAKACKTAGYISGYLHMTSVDACKTAIANGPFIVGSDWWTSMDNPTATGLVQVSGTVRGGHEYECIGYDTATDLWEFVNSWGTEFGADGHFFYSSPSFTKLLADQGDATQFVALSQPAPVPAPVPTPDPAPTPAPVNTVTKTFTAADAAALDAWATLPHIYRKATAAAKAWKRAVT
jgi:hypothetical protein